MSKTLGWFKLLGGITAIALFVGLAHWGSPKLPGAAGKVYRQNVEQQIEADALLYTEIGPIREFLDERDGKYGLRLNLDGSVWRPKPLETTCEQPPETNSP